MVTLGPPGAGKSSTVETLRNQRTSCVDCKTEVADLRQLDLTPQDSVQVFDEGGDDVYKITSPIFNTPKSIPMLVHDMTKVDGTLSNSADIFRQNLLLHPENQVLVVLTHIDKCNLTSQQKNKDVIMSSFNSVIDNEIQMLAVSRTGTKPQRKTLIDLLENQKKGLKCFPISCKTYDGVPELLDFLTTLVQQRRVVLPQSWLQFYKEMMKQDPSFFRKCDLQALYAAVRRELKNDAQQLQSQFLQSLIYFADVGLILYYHKVSGLDQYIFHRPQFVVDVLKAVFHHNVGTVLDYDKNEFLRGIFKRADLKVLAARFQKEGLMDTRLLDVLWEQCKLHKEDKNALQQLMESFHLCHPISRTSRLVYFPWFVALNTPPDSVDLKNITKFDQTQMSVQFQCKFVPCIPLNVFETIIVHLQKTASEKGYTGDRYAWKDGLLVTFETIQAVLIRDEVNNVISSSVSGDICDVDKIWDISKDSEASATSTLDQYDGINAEILYACGHCLMLGKSKPRLLNPESVLRSANPRTKCVMCGTDRVPWGLVRACPGKLLCVDCQYNF